MLFDNGKAASKADMFVSDKMVLPGRFELPFAASETAALSIELRELTALINLRHQKLNNYVNIKTNFEKRFSNVCLTDIRTYYSA